MSAITPEKIDEALKRTGGNQTEAAQILGCSRSRVWRHCKESKNQEEIEGHRKLRAAESKLTTLSNNLKEEKKRREIAEKDLEEALADDQVLQSVEYEPRVISTPRRGRSKNQATPILLCSDWHAESNIDPRTINGLNEFNLDICRRRVERLFRKAVYLTEFGSHLCETREMVLWAGGDLINGFIHEELEESNFLGPAEAVVFVSELLSGGIKYILDSGCVDHIHVVCSMGNHGRSTKKRRVSTGYRSSWEYLAYKTLASSYANDDQVSWTVNPGYFTYVDVLGHTCRFSHGDNIRYSGGVGGITIPVEKAIKSWNEGRYADYDFFGHYHQLVENNRWVCNGSLVGFDDYALSIKARFEPPKQAICFIDEEYGKTMTLPIFVEKPRSE